MRAQLAILWCAARGVPRRQRAEWLAEWTAELWYVRQGGGGQATSFCLGAFRDALWVRRNRPARSRTMLRLETPAQCLGIVGLLAAACAFFAFRLPEVRSVVLPFAYRDVERLVLLSPAGQIGSRSPALTLGQYRNLANRPPQGLEGAAFYRPARARAAGTDLTLALATGNLFELLGLPVSRDRELPALVVSDSASRKLFGADPHVRGRVVEAAGRRSVITAVIPADSWQLPGRIDAWLIDDDALAALPDAANGYVVGRLVQPLRDSHPRVSALNGYGRYDSFGCGSLSSYPILAMPAVVFIALLVAAATISPRFGGYPKSHHYRTWLFLGAKIALVLPLVFFCTLALQAMIAVEIRPCVVFGYVIAFRWILMDQQRRCPECLRLLARPARIGLPSQTFLGWYGTEFMCVKGHGLLHVSESPTISSETQRWLRLDQSWTALFS